MATDFSASPHSTPNTSAATTTTTTSSPQEPFPFPPSHSFPPFFSPQPTLTTHTAQLRKWSSLILKYFAHHRLHILHLTTAPTMPLFHNATIRKRASPQFIAEVVDFMASAHGEFRAEWVSASAGTSSSLTTSSSSSIAEKSSAWIWWRRPDEWADLLLSYIDSTAQKGSVLTLYEIVHGEGSKNTEFAGLDMRVLQRALGVCVKRGRAQVFGGEGEEGVKFF